MLDLSPEDARRLLARTMGREPLGREVTCAIELLDRLVQRLIRTGEIRAVPMPDGSLKVDIEDVNRWLERQQGETNVNDPAS